MESKVIEKSRSKVKTLSSKKAEHVHFSKGENHYVASNNGSEILIFPANKNGEIIKHSEVTDPWTIEASNYLFDLY